MYKNVKNLITALNLTDAQIEMIYYYQQSKFVQEDVKNHAIELLDIERICNSEYEYVLNHLEELAERYVSKYADADRPENDNYKCLILDYLRDKLKKYKIPVTWEMCGTVEVYAESTEMAVKYTQDNLDELPPPDDAEYVDDSFKLSSDSLEENIIMAEN